jgi:hypothetical protein
MKIALLMTLFLSIPAWGKCSLYEISGLVRKEQNKYVLVVAPKTGSEKTLKVELFQEDRFLPYADQFIKGQFILDNVVIATGSEIKDVKAIDNAVYNPLDAGEENTWKKIKDTECPKD